VNLYFLTFGSVETSLKFNTYMTL